MRYPRKYFPLKTYRGFLGLRGLLFFFLSQTQPFHNCRGGIDPVREACNPVSSITGPLWFKPDLIVLVLSLFSWVGTDFRVLDGISSYGSRGAIRNVVCEFVFVV